MTETSLNTETKKQSPFQEQIVLDNYFATENTENILRSINRAIVDGVSLVFLSGDEGSGKTMLCYKLDADPKKTCKTVFFPRTVDSFVDVVRIVAVGLGIDPQKSGDKPTVEEILEEISSSLIVDDEPLLLIFDEAENIYLATLERIRKMLDRLSDAGGRIHVLFSGRQAFLENCQQLSMCDFQNTEEHHVHIEPLSEEETLEYLLHSCTKLPDVDGEVIFTEEVVHNIYQLADGNFRMTNILAEEAIQKEGNDTSFMVLLENVKEDVGEKGDGSETITIVKDYIEKYRGYLPHAVVGLGVVFLCLVFLFLRKDEPLEIESKTLVAQNENSSSALGSQGESRPVKVEPVADTALQPVVPDPTVQTEETEVEAVPVVQESTADQKSETEIDVQQQTDSLTVEEVESAQTEVVEGEVKDIPEEAPEEVEEAALPVLIASKVVRKEKKPIEIVELLRDDNTKKRPGKLPKTTQITIKEQRIKQERRNEVREVIASNAHFTVEQLYKKRLMAGSSWYNQTKNDKYTVQVMVLTSDTAEGNLKKMLLEERYRQEAGNFYIFKKHSTSDTIFVFYGEYPTISQARLAQNSLPQFLRKHKPYAISVKGAMAKVRR